eukprot:2102551-Amphidinium_carterae.1
MTLSCCQDCDVQSCRGNRADPVLDAYHLRNKHRIPPKCVVYMMVKELERKKSSSERKQASKSNANRYCQIWEKSPSSPLPTAGNLNFAFLTSFYTLFLHAKPGEFVTT